MICATQAAQQEPGKTQAMAWISPAAVAKNARDAGFFQLRRGVGVGARRISERGPLEIAFIGAGTVSVVIEAFENGEGNISGA